MDNPRLARFKELKKAGDSLSPVERTERDALAAEFPETAASFAADEVAQAEKHKKSAAGESGIVSSGNPTGRGR